MGDAEHEPEHDEPMLRRALLGYRRKDVEGALIARRAEIEELRGEVAALRHGFDQHERSIRHLIAAIEALEGTIASASGSATTRARPGEAASDPRPGPS